MTFFYQNEYIKKIKLYGFDIFRALKSFNSFFNFGRDLSFFVELARAWPTVIKISLIVVLFSVFYSTNGICL